MFKVDWRVRVGFCVLFVLALTALLGSRYSSATSPMGRNTLVVTIVAVWVVVAGILAVSKPRRR